MAEKRRGRVWTGLRKARGGRTLCVPLGSSPVLDPDADLDHSGHQQTFNQISPRRMIDFLNCDRELPMATLGTINKRIYRLIAAGANSAAGKMWDLGSWADHKIKDAERDAVFERDHGEIMKMIGDYEGKRFEHEPPDPRTVDPVLLRNLRERLENKYSYQWRATRANAELIDALYAGCTQTDGRKYTLCVETMFLNKKGESPPLWWRPFGLNDEYKRHYYITACSVDVHPFITSHDDAVRLLRSVLPGWGYSLQHANNCSAVRLERGSEVGPWKEGYPALALVTAILDRLERFPEEAAHWRSV
ncbi:MAG: hypothetical protein INR71_12165 [Terriglobus roseus]|nr:hypothetical protein [Terriglobus roseus]